MRSKSFQRIREPALALLVVACSHRSEPSRSDATTSQALAAPDAEQPVDEVPQMRTSLDVSGVRNDRIQVVTFRPEGARFAVLDRQIAVVGPPDLVEFVERAKRANRSDLQALLPLLDDPNRSWAAEAVLAAVTGEEVDIVNTFAGMPSEFHRAVGVGARARWTPRLH